MSNKRTPPGAMMAQYDKFVSILLISLGLSACGGGGGGGDDNQQPPPQPPPPTSSYSISISTTSNGTVVASNITDNLSETCAVGNACTFNYNQDTQVILTAQPQLRYRFKQWTGDCNGPGPCSIVPTVNHSVSAIYEQIPGADQACVETTPVPVIPDIDWQQITAGLNNPLAISSANGINNRLFIVEQSGMIRTVTHGVLDAGSFLDISDRVRVSGGTSLDDLSGLMSIAMHPQFASNGLFYVYYISTRLNIIPNPRCQTSDVCVIVSEFDSTAADVELSERILLDIPMNTANNLAGHIAFGPESTPMLYISVSYNSHALTGNVLRINITAQSGGPEYSIPSDNPVQIANASTNTFTSNTLRQEIWATGLRNPWRFSFDALNGNLFLGDVTAFSDEINLINPGLDYGWSTCVGSYAIVSLDCFPFNGSGADGYDPFFSVFQTEPALTTSSNNTVGGVVYRGSQYADLCGAYIYGDYSGNIRGLRYYAGNITEQKDLTALNGVIAFGTGQDREIYAVVRSTGTLYQLIVP